MANNDLAIFSGNSSLELADKISEYLQIQLGEAKVSTFSDGETQIEINTTVRGQDVCVIQSTSYPANQNYMELFLMIDAFKRSSAKRITAVIPYFGYSRQDKKVKPRVPISGKLMADLLQAAGASRIITIDLHAAQIQGFFDIPVDNLFASPVLVKDIPDFIGTCENLVIVSPDAGGVERARSYAKRLGAGLAIIDKRRDEPNKARAMNVIGDVVGKVAIIVDDIIDTAGTLDEAVNALLKNDANKVYACCTHAVFSGKAIYIMTESKISGILTTDTIPLREEAKCLVESGKVKVITVSRLLGEAILRGHDGRSVTSLFE